MDRKLNKRIAEYVGEFKKNIRNKAIELDFAEREKIESLVSFVFDYDRLVLSKDDVSKRKRIKNSIPCLNRCHAKRANGEQCTRKQKEGCLYCGTHEKGTPHGIIQDNTRQDGEVVNEGNGNVPCLSNELVVSEVFAEEIGGIVYYLDKHFHVFNTEDVLNKKENPEVIATYIIDEQGTYHIPAYGI